MNISRVFGRGFAAMTLLMFSLILVSSSLGVENGGYPNSGFLVTTQWLQDHIGDPDIRILDRQDILPEDKIYVQGHVPNAIQMSRDATKIERRGILEVLDPKVLINFLEDNGISANHHVVIIGNSHKLPTVTRIFWALEFLGHKKISIVDGGTEKWLAEKRPWTTEVPHFAKTTYQVNLNRDRLVTGDELVAYLGNFKELGIVVVDSRMPDEFSGAKMSRVSEKLGHIPGAINLFFGKTLNGETYKEFKTADEIKKILHSQGITPDKNVFFTCVSGCFGSVLYFEARLLDYPKAAVYDGAWIEWSRKDYPVEVTAETTGNEAPKSPPVNPAPQNSQPPKAPASGC